MRWFCAITVSLCVFAWIVPNARATTITGHVIGPHGAKVRDAVVYLVGPKGGSPPQKHAVLDQKNQSFIPHVLAIQVGMTVDFPNHDTVFHNVFSFRDGKRFDLGMYPVGAKKSLVFDKPGLSKIFCNIHSNMSAVIYVLENPYFDVTGADGSFSIKNAPEGNFTLRVSHENLGEKQESLSVHGSQISEDLSLRK